MRSHDVASRAQKSAVVCTAADYVADMDVERVNAVQRLAVSNAAVLNTGDALALVEEHEAVGALVGRLVVAVAFDDNPNFARLAERAAQLPCVFVCVGPASDEPAGPGPGAVGLDVNVPDIDGLAAIVATVERSSAAAVALVQLLRLGDHLDLHDALVAESMAYGLLQSGQTFRQWLRSQPARTHRPTELPVRVERNDATLRCTIDRPEVSNAFDAATRDAVVDAMAVATADPTITVVELCGDGPDFCSGGDLSEFGVTPDPVVAHLVRTTRSAGRAIAAVAEATTAYLHGACVGAGIELPAFAGRVVASPDTRISLPEVAMGLIPGAGGTVSLARRIGRRRTAWLALTGETIDAATAFEWGLVDELTH